MKFDKKLVPGKIIKRYKRFLMDLEVGGEIITAHIANTGSMKTCWQEGWDAMLYPHDNPKRKYKYSVEIVHNRKSWINVNTHATNKIVKEALENRMISELTGDYSIRSEYKVGNSRFDFLVEDSGGKTFVEVKNVTLAGDNGEVLFPDSVSTRGQKHLRELMDLKRQGHRAMMLYVVSREDGCSFSIARDIDSQYGELFDQARLEGVEIAVYQCVVNPNEVRLYKSMPLT